MTAEKARRPGKRPNGAGADPVISLRCSPKLTEALDRARAEQSPVISRSRMIRIAAEEWLRARGYVE
jgi:hypothetical protein